MKPLGLPLLSALVLCASLPAVASSVLAVSLERLSTRSELIFEGEVVSVQSTLDPDQTGIHTYVTFRIADVITGNYIEPEITLRFLGGTVGGIRLEVADSTLPDIGEAGIYFVESLTRFQVNPFYGMNQGHFLILESNSQRIMTTRSGRIVNGFRSANNEASLDELSNGAALGLSVDEAGDSLSGVTVLQFKLKILEYLSDNQ